MALGALQFAAFLSYSRKDERLARWLVRALEDFQPPRQTIDELKARGAGFTAPRPIFRDVHDMPVGGAIPDRLAEVIDASAAMIVLCTPASVQSDWVDKEIRLFAERHPDRRIIAVVAEGDPDRDECYPRALLALGKPLAADLRSPAARKQAVVKIAAAMLGLDVDQLVGRVGKRRAERVRWIATGASVIAGVMIGLGATAVFMTMSAGRANKSARSSIDVLLTDVRDEVKARGQLASQARILTAAEKYFDGKSPNGMADEDLLLKAKLMVQKGEDAVERGDATGALEFREAAFAATQELLSRRKDDPERLFAHGQSAFWVGDLYWRRADLDQASYYFELYKTMSEDVVAKQPDYPGAVMEVAYAKANVGQVMVEQFYDVRKASELFAEAIRTIEPEAKDIPSKLSLSVIMGFQAQAMAQFEPASKVLAMVEAWSEVVGELDKARSADRSLNYDVARDLNMIGEFEIRAGLQERGAKRVAQARAIASEELRSDSGNSMWLSLASRLELKAATQGCPRSPAAASSFNFADEVEIRRALSCLEHGDGPRTGICRAFVDWLAVQKPRYIAQITWSRVLGVCSRAKEVVSDEELFQAQDHVAHEMFFSRELLTHSIWTQIELAKFNSAGLNTTEAAALKDDLKRRGWDGG
jgi:TIR domain